MKLSNAFSLLVDLFHAFKCALIPTIKHVLFISPSLIFRPRALSGVFMAKVWNGGFANGTDEGGRGVKEHLITPNAYGAVLDLGAGHGHSVRYFNRARVTKYVALEPNKLMHMHIRAAANAGGYHESDGSLVLLSCGAEDSAAILAASPQVDTIISVLTLCTIPQPHKTVSNLVRDVLKPGGQFLFYEHVLSHRADVAWWQRFWAPLWQIAFDGCRIDRASHLVVEGLTAVTATGEAKESVWREGELWGKPDEPEESLFWHQVGKFVKK